MEGQNISYKGLPLVRNNDEFYYGNPTDANIIYLKILSIKKVGDSEIADKVHVSLVSTDTTLDMVNRMKKQGIKEGLYNALDVGAVWLKSSL